jgi:hypothetical protein
VSPRVFPNLRRTHEYKNLALCKQLSFDFVPSFSIFVEKKYFHGNMGTYKIGELPQHSAIRFFCYRKSLKIHIENEKGVVYVASFFLFLFWFCLFVWDIFRGE